MTDAGNDLGHAELNAILATFVDSPVLTSADLEGSSWRLFDIGGRLISPFLVLAPQGLVGNGGTGSAEIWQMVNGTLSFAGESGATSIAFGLVRRDETGRIITFAGQGVIDGVEALYLLRAVEHPDHPLHAAPADADRSIAFLKQVPQGQRRANLVVVPAGPQSLHPYWLEAIDDDARNWDLCVGYYGAERPGSTVPCDYLAHIPQSKKFRLLHDLFQPDSPLWDYEAIWFADDDLLASGAGINLMFHLFRKFGMDLAQPALIEGENCFPNDPLAIMQDGSDVRFEGNAEILWPVFSRRALRICIGSMRDAESGYGLSRLWPAFLGYPRGRIGIIDVGAVAHTRPIGYSYDIRRAINEQSALYEAYGYQGR